VTGGSSGIGLETARRLCRQGAEVCLVARRPEPCEAAVGELGERAWAWPCDVAEAEQVAGLAEAVAQRWSALDGLVCSAGIAIPGSLEETEVEAWDQTFAVNTRGPYLLMRQLLPLLRAGHDPAVVNVSSTLAEKPIPAMAAYNASKAALNQLTRSLALELAPQVRVNAVMPAVVDTPIHATRGLSREQVEAMGAIHPLRRIGQPADVAELIVFLLSRAAAWITGTVIPVDGGMMVT
jgi:3-oxoacyl-[acyl-carrier protein] reductase